MCFAANEADARSIYVGNVSNVQRVTCDVWRVACDV